MKLKEIVNRKLFSSRLSVLALLILLGVFSISGTLAYLVVSSSQVTNTFVPGVVTCQVEESFDETTKSDVAIRNTGNVDAYIRAAVVVNWIDAQNNICAATHAAPSIGYNTTDWTQGSDGFWYYTDPVAPNELTANLINTATSAAQADGCRLQIEIIASAIQAEGTGASGAADAWGIDPTASGN